MSHFEVHYVLDFQSNDVCRKSCNVQEYHRPEPAKLQPSNIHRGESILLTLLSRKENQQISENMPGFYSNVLISSHRNIRIGKGSMARGSRASNASSTASSSATSTTSSISQRTTTRQIAQQQLRNSTQVSRRGSMSTSESRLSMNESEEFGWGHFVDITPI
jgi:hypothetical protein